MHPEPEAPQHTSNEARLRAALTNPAATSAELRPRCRVDNSVHTQRCKLPEFSSYVSCDYRGICSYLVLVSLGKTCYDIWRCMTA